MKDLRTLVQMMRQLFVILNVKQRRRMFGMMLVILIGSLFELLGVSAILPFIQAFLDPEQLLEKPYIRWLTNLFGIRSSSSLLLFVSLLIILIYLVKNLYLSWSSYLQIAYCYNTQRELAVQMLKAFMCRPYSFFVESGSGVIWRGVSVDIEGVYKVILNLFKLASEGFVIIAISIYLFIIDPVMSSGVLCIGLFCALVIVLGVKRSLINLSYQHRKANAEINKWVSHINSGIKDIMVYDRKELFVERYDHAYKNANVAMIRNEYTSTVPERIIEFFCISGVFVMVLIRAGREAGGSNLIPQLAVFAMGAFRLLPSISRVTGYIALLIFNRTKLEATYENIVAARNEVETEASLVSQGQNESVNRFHEYIEMRDVSWRYPSGTNNVLDGFTMTIRKGEAIGIIGESGSGKSTMADILLRLYKPQRGAIFMDGTDISTIPRAWKKILAYVPQNVFLMDDTIRENVSFGEQNVKDQDIWDALRQSSLDGFVRELPEGLDTIVGERGVKFSGGQIQRIAIARALYTRPQFLILDEATSALDNETEEAVMEAIDSLAGTITLLIIAHRVTTLKNCNRIYEITGGKAVERDKKTVMKTEVLS